MLLKCYTNFSKTLRILLDLIRRGEIKFDFNLLKLMNAS